MAASVRRAYNAFNQNTEICEATWFGFFKPVASSSPLPKFTYPHY